MNFHFFSVNHRNNPNDLVELSLQKNVSPVAHHIFRVHCSLTQSYQSNEALWGATCHYIPPRDRVGFWKLELVSSIVRAYYSPSTSDNAQRDEHRRQARPVRLFGDTNNAHATIQINRGRLFSFFLAFFDACCNIRQLLQTEDGNLWVRPWRLSPLGREVHRSPST